MFSLNILCIQKAIQKKKLLNLFFRFFFFQQNYTYRNFHSVASLCDPMDYNPPGSSVHGILWTAYPFLSPGDVPDPGIEPRSPALQADFYHEPPGKPHLEIKIFVTPDSLLREKNKICCSLRASNSFKGKCVYI